MMAPIYLNAVFLRFQLAQFADCTPMYGCHLLATGKRWKTTGCL